jgi:hypothetical protein
MYDASVSIAQPHVKFCARKGWRGLYLANDFTPLQPKTLALLFAASIA